MLFSLIKGIFLMKYISFRKKISLNRLTIKRTRKNLKRKEYKEDLRSVSSPDEQSHPDPRLAHILTVPEIFDFVKAPDETIEFFSVMKKHIDAKRAIRLDFVNVTQFSVNALLYLLAQMQNYRMKGFEFSISGNAPIDEKCKKLFLSSGFYKYVKSDKEMLEDGDSNVMCITSGDDHDSDLVKQLCQFIQEKLEKSKLETQSIFEAVNEMMNNTVSHAYDIRKNGKNKADRWFFFANYDEIKKVVDVAFLDTGSGIPYTVQRKFTEALAQLVLNTHADIIMSALRGEFRTRTKEGNRSKGLPSIYAKYLAGDMRRLVIVSGKGYIIEDRPRNLREKFTGTLYSWQIHYERAN